MYRWIGLGLLLAAEVGCCGPLTDRLFSPVTGRIDNTNQQMESMRGELSRTYLILDETKTVMRNMEAQVELTNKRLEQSNKLMERVYQQIEQTNKQMEQTNKSLKPLERLIKPFISTPETLLVVEPITTEQCWAGKLTRCPAGDVRTLPTAPPPGFVPAP